MCRSRRRKNNSTRMIPIGRLKKWVQNYLQKQFHKIFEICLLRKKRNVLLNDFTILKTRRSLSILLVFYQVYLI